MQAKGFSLVADIGGTNARFALVEDGTSKPVEPRNLVCADYLTIVDAIKAYLEQVSFATPYQAALSVASPVIGDQLNMTNLAWSFSVAETRKAVGLGHLKVINDYTALALALPSFTEDQCIKVGSGEMKQGHTKAVLGPGTGLGVSGVIPVGDLWVPLASEGGHVSYGPLTQRESEIIQIMREKFEHVSAESLVSGPGLSLIYQVISRLEGAEVERLHPHEVTDLAINDNCPIAVESVSIFCGILGSVAGNLALTLGARGGVYIGGGITSKILDFFVRSSFRERFEQHGRLTRYLYDVPTYVINTDYPALIGAVVSLSQQYEKVGVVSHEAE